MFSRIKSLWGNTAFHMFVTNFGGVKVYLLNNKGNDHMLMS